MITIGPHRFTASDARRTVENLEPLWGLFARDPDLEAHLRPLYPTLTGDVETDLPAVWHAFLAAGPSLRAGGHLPRRHEGLVDSLHLGSGGVPKPAVDAVEVDFGGVVGDRQKVRVHHGRPWQALCLWSAEVIEQFAADGHPIAAGFAGENITVRGLPWADVQAGVRLQLGTVVCDVIAYALPCRANRGWFRNGEFQLMHHDRGPVSRVYAVVVEPGFIRTGDLAILEP